MASQQILVVEDERPIANILKYNLEQEGYAVSLAYDGKEALDKVRGGSHQLVILDIMLPKLDGFSVCRQVRQESPVPILMLTAKDEEDDKVQGLELGADDYVTKPFSPREVTARVKALLRRSVGDLATAQGAESADGVLHFDGLSIDTRRQDAYRGDRALDLTRREYELLAHLVSEPGRVFSRETLLEDVWGYDYYGDIRTVDVTIRRLRKKLEEDASDPRYLHTRRGVGYFFSPTGATGD